MNMESTREWMINHQIRPWNVINPLVLDALGQVKREEFVPEAYRGLAFADTEIPLPQGQNMLKPVLEGRLLQVLELADEHTVLVVGTGSGYLTACIATLAGQVTAIDRYEELTNHAQTALALSKIGNTELLTADFSAFEPGRQFDRILLTGAIPALDERLPEWLNEDGLLIAPIGAAPSMEVEAVRRSGDQYSRTRLFETVVTPLENVAQPASFVF